MYFSIVTLALGEIFRIIVHNLHDFTGGPEGVVMQQGVMSEECQQAVLAGTGRPFGSYRGFVLVEKSRINFALTAIRNNEISAKSSGVDIFRWLLLALS